MPAHPASFVEPLTGSMTSTFSIFPSVALFTFDAGASCPTHVTSQPPKALCLPPGLAPLQLVRYSPVAHAVQLPASLSVSRTNVVGSSDSLSRDAHPIRRSRTCSEVSSSRLLPSSPHMLRSPSPQQRKEHDKECMQSEQLRPLCGRKILQGTRCKHRIRRSTCKFPGDRRCKCPMMLECILIHTGRPLSTCSWQERLRRLDNLHTACDGSSELRGGG